MRIDLMDGKDVRLLPHIGRRVHGILMAPPCTHFSTAQGVRSWGKKGAKAVIVTDGDQKVVNVDNPDALKGHEGHHVAVTGAMTGDSIHVDSVKML